jgi:hypothetical protein
MCIRLRTALHPGCWLAARSHSGIRCSRFQSDGRLFLTTGRSLGTTSAADFQDGARCACHHPLEETVFVVGSGAFT